jgi:hypothetical protein
MSSQRAIVMLRDSAGGEAQAHLLGGEQVDDEGRVCAVLDHAGSLVLPLGGEAELELQGSDGEPSLLLHARVIQHRVGRDTAWYVLEIDASDRPLLATQADRRVHDRARPSVVAPVEAVLSAPDGTLARAVTVKDLSESGAGLILRPPEELDLLRQPRLRLALTLPGQEHPLDLRARLVFRRLAGPLIQYGVSFDAYASPNFELSRERLSNWVGERRSLQGARRAV